MNSFKTITSVLLVVSCFAFGCADDSAGATAGTTAAECVRGDLVSQCPPNTMPELSANSEAICSTSGEASADAVSGMGRVENVCAGSGSCQLVCRLIDPCEFGVVSVSEAEGVICRIPEGGCGDGLCEAGEDPTSCPQDCEGDCTGLTSRCVDGQLQRCAPNGVLETPMDCPPSYTCVEADDDTASCEGGCEPGTSRCSDGQQQRCSESGVYELPEACLEEEVCREENGTAQCVAAACGDSVIQEGVEQCDDGNNITEPCAYGVESCTVCNAMCMEVAGEAAFCGDDILQDGEEECDDGDAIQSPCPYNETSCTVCDTQCNFVPGDVGSICGDNLVDETNGEACDGGEATVSDAGACPLCQPAACGDGYTRRDVPDANDPFFEACDDANDTNFGDGCNDTCQVTEIDGPLNVACDVGAEAAEGGSCPIDGMGACESGFSCVSRSFEVLNAGTRGEEIVESGEGQCQQENSIKFSGEVNGNRVARLQGQLTTQNNGPVRDADVFTYEQRCGYGDDPGFNGNACAGDYEAQYLFVLDFDVPTQMNDGGRDFPGFGPSVVENTCNGSVNDGGSTWTNCLCRDFHPLCAVPIGERKRAFWCVSATEVGEYTVRIGGGKDGGWPARTIGYTLEITEMLNQSGCEAYVPDDDELCSERVSD